MQQTTTTKSQYIKKCRNFVDDGEPRTVILTMRYDDECGNGHNTFSATIDVYERGEWCEGGANNDLIACVFPEYARYLQWHMVSTHGPLHYISNTTSHAEERALDAARWTAVWPEATDEDLTAPGLKERLEARLPQLLEDFQRDMEELGFIY